MKPVLFAATLLFGVTAVHAQEAPMYHFISGVAVGSVPDPFYSASCLGDNPGFGARVGFARRIFRNLDLQTTGTAIMKVGQCKAVVILTVPPDPGVYAYQSYGDNISENPLISADLRANFHTNGRVSLELGGGAGWGFIQNVPYGVVAGGMRFGSGLQVGLGAELRSYRIPYDLVVTVISEQAPAHVSRHEGGHTWRHAPFITLNVSQPLGRKRDITAPSN